jgi:HEAT repeat protein
VSGRPEDAGSPLASADLEERCRGVARLADVPGEESTRALVRLLEEPSWFLRERVVEALGRRPGSWPSVARVLREGPWYARASACDVLGLLADPAAASGLVEQLEDRNVSIQKSAAAALERVAREHGDGTVAAAIARLPPERRRRVAARIAHQSPAWSSRLSDALRELPADAFAPPDAVSAAAPRSSDGAEPLARFRKFLAGLPPAGGEA